MKKLWTVAFTIVFFFSVASSAFAATREAHLRPGGSQTATSYPTVVNGCRTFYVNANNFNSNSVSVGIFGPGKYVSFGELRGFGDYMNSRVQFCGTGQVYVKLWCNNGNKCYANARLSW